MEDAANQVQVDGPRASGPERPSAIIGSWGRWIRASLPWPRPPNEPHRGTSKGSLTETAESPEGRGGSSPTRRSIASGGAILWIGTLFYGGSTVGLLSILSRHLGHSSFSALSALVSLAFVVGLIPAGLQLRSASLVTDGRPPPRMTWRQTAAIATASLAISPLFAFLLHVPELSCALICLQMLIAIPLALQQGAFLGLRQFRHLGVNLLIEGLARLVMGAVAGSLWGLTGLSAGLCAGTAAALIALPSPGSLDDKNDRPRTSLIDTSLALACCWAYTCRSTS